MISRPKYFSAGLLVLLTQAAFAQSPPSPASSNFAVLGSAAVTCTSGNITGQVGTNQSLTDVPPGAVVLVGCAASGIHVGDQAAKDAYAAFLAGYAALAPKPEDICTEVLSGTLDGRTLSPGTYCFPAAATLTGVLTLNGPASATWIFKIGSTIATPPALPTGALTGTNFSVVMAGGGQACNVTWWVAEAVTMTDSNLKGNILAGAATTLTRGTLTGNDFAKAGATITGTAVTACAMGSTPPPGPGAKSCPDKVTGGGYITVNGSNANFGVTAGIKKDAFRGELTYLDHGQPFKVKGTRVTAYVVIDARTRRIGGTAKVNGQSGFTYEVDVTDNGEPGRNDSFAIRVSNAAGFVYTASGTLAGGNIQLHKRNCDKNGHDRDDDDDDGDDHRADDDGDRDGDHDGDKRHDDGKNPYDKRR